MDRVTYLAPGGDNNIVLISDLMKHLHWHWYLCKQL